ncbi:ROK family protein [Flindersiella endophytica]
MDGPKLNRNATSRDVRRGNRSVLLSRLYFDGPLSRLELSRITALSTATVSNLTGELLEEGLVEEAGSVESDGGRPRTLLRIAPRFGYVVGVDVGETGVRVELFDLAMTPLAKADHPVASALPDPSLVADRVLTGLDQVLLDAGVAADSLLGVGIGVFGVVEQGLEAIVDAQTIGWRDVPLERMLRTGTSAPLHIDNGAKTLGQAELWFGAGRGAQHAVIALVGSGVGAAVVTHGTSYRGATSSAGEWGHTRLVYDGRPCRCGARGCLEAYVGAEGILDRYRQAGGAAAAVGGSEESELAALLVAADDGSATAGRVLSETAGYLGAGIADLINLFNPERVVLSGWAGLMLGGRLLPEIREAARSNALRRPFAGASIELGRLGPDAVAVGAATLPVARLLASGGAV